MKKRAFYYLLLLFFPLMGKSQDIDWGIKGGISLYSGDLSPQEFGLYFEDISPAAGIFTRMRYSRHLGSRLGFTFGQISGNERQGGVNRERGLNFQTHIAELSALAEIHLFHMGYASSKTTLSPYLIGGIGLYHFDPRTLGPDKIRLRPLGTEGQGAPGYPGPYSPLQFSIPFGFGINFIIKDQWTIGLEVMAHRSLSDYLDDVATRQVRYGDIFEHNGELAARLSNPLIEPTSDNFDLNYTRGGKYADYFYTPGITVSYRLKNRGLSKSRYQGKDTCPRF